MLKAGGGQKKREDRCKDGGEECEKLDKKRRSWGPVWRRYGKADQNSRMSRVTANRDNGGMVITSFGSSIAIQASSLVR